MIYFNLENGYESFKELFGEREVEVDGQIKKVRKNKIVLNVLKDMFKLKSRFWNDYFVYDKNLQFTCQQELIDNLKFLPNYSDCRYRNYFDELRYTLCSSIYRVDNEGLCYDGDANSIRYEKDGKIYKMKASKFYSTIFTECGYDVVFGTKAMIFCAEKFAESWCAYAQKYVCNDKYTLHVGNKLSDFSEIYSAKGMGSCMTNTSQYRFYKNSVNASAAWIENEDEGIVARCVIFNEATQCNTGKVFRLAERQYAIDENDKLKSILVRKLYDEGYIDAHKRVGAGCHDNMEFCDVSGKLLDDCEFEIHCNIDYGDTLSYQDSFVSYDMDCHTAYNFDCDYETDRLDTTNTMLEGENYDDWEDCYTHEEVSEVYWENSTRSIVCGNTTNSNIEADFTYVDCGEYRDYYLHNDIVVYIDGDYWYYKDEEICEACDDGEYHLKEDCYYYDGYYYAFLEYSKLLREDIPYDVFDDIEEEYAEENGYVKDENGDWIKKVEELAEA